MNQPADRKILTILRQQKVAPVIVLTVALLAAANWVLSPEEALRWLRNLLILPLLWLGLTLWHYRTLLSVRRRNVDDESAVTRYFSAALSLVVITLGILQIATLSLTIWARVGDHGADIEIERRILGIAIGCVWVFYGNAIPKILTPFAMLPPDLAARVTTARRFFGTTAVLLGLATILAFLVAPLAIAQALFKWALVAGGLALVGTVVWMNLAPARRNR